MTPELLLVLPIGFIWVPAMTWLLLRLDTGRTSMLWLAGWLALWSGAVLLALAQKESFLLVGANGLVGLFAALMLLGTYALQKRPPPRLLPLGLAALVTTSAVLHLVDPGRGRWAASLLGVSLLSFAAWRLIRHHTPRPEVGIAERALGPAMVLLVGVAATNGWMLTPGRPKYALIGAGITVSVGMILIQLLVLAERARERERKLREERGILHRVALAGADLRDPRGAFAEALSQVQYLNLFLAFGVWCRTADGNGLEYVAGHLPDGIELPEPLRRPSLELPVLQAALQAEHPLVLDQILGDARISEVVRSHGLEGGFVAPLRLGSEVVGMMGGLFRPDQGLDEDGRRFVSDLADEAAVVLAAARLRETERPQRLALDAERRMLRGMTEAVPVGIVLTDAEGVAQLVNLRACEVLGVAGPAQWIGRPASELMIETMTRLEEATQRTIERHVDRFAADRRRVLPETELRFRDGRVGVLSARPVLSAKGAHVGRVWIARDVTDERQAAERIQLVQRMETVGTLAGGLAHDFNNQLTAIMGIADELLENSEQKAKTRGDLEYLIQAAEHCAELTHGLLTFARRQPAEPRPVELAPAVTRMETLLRPSLPAAVELRVRVADDAGWILADELQLQRVVTNLVVNARDAVGREGSVALEVSRRCADEQPERIEILVRDDGGGIDESTRRRIFDPFFTTKTNDGGTGLGLAIVYAIVEGHGGCVEVESAPGEGSTFRIDWPAAKAPAEARRAGSARRRPAEGRGTILLADDEPTLLRLLAKALVAAGFRVVTAEDGDAAVAAFEKHGAEIDAALVDLAMPGRSGLEVIAAIRAHAPSLPAAVMSGHPDRAAPNWPDDVPLLMKPFRVARASELMEQLLMGGDLAASDPQS